MERRTVWIVLLTLAAVGVLVVSAACRTNDGEAEPLATSLLGRPLFAAPQTDEFRAEQGAKLARAEADLENNPADPNALIWVGRRLAYLARYADAIEIYTRGIEEHARDARFLRHRGHRYITLRRLDDAIADLDRAAELVAGRPDEVEPDGLPNERNIPTSTLQSNIWYHLGLAYYLKGRLEDARRAYARCMEVSNNPDMLCATSHWFYMTLRRLGQAEQARELLDPIHAGMDIIENHDYHRLLLMYKGQRPAEQLFEEVVQDESALSFATTAYGIGNWYLYNGDEDRAREIFARIVETEPWAAFGFIAAEAELARVRPAE